jgi:hypothetical protein
MNLQALLEKVQSRYHIEERWHACAILSQDFPEQLQDVIDCLNQFTLLKSEIVVGGGRKSKIADRFDKFFAGRGWQESSTSIKMVIGERTVEMGTHKVDYCKGKIAVELEWNNKDPFYSTDLNAFRVTSTIFLRDR